MPKSRPQPPRPDRRRSIRGSFSWIDHRFLREGFDQGLTRLEKLPYFVLVAVCNQDGVSFYSDARLAELLDIRFPHELDGARRKGSGGSSSLPDHALRSSSSLPPVAELHCVTRLRIWRASSSCCNAGVGGVHEALRGLSVCRARQRLSLSSV
jgi:hypothetical protein